MAALAAVSVPTMCSLSEVTLNTIGLSISLSAGSRIPVTGVQLISTRSSPWVSSNGRAARLKLPSRIASFNDEAPPMVAGRSSSAVHEFQAERLHPTANVAPLSMTYLEGSSWLLEVLGIKFLVDPVLVGNLVFGNPWIYDAGKRTYKNFKLEDLPDVDYLLITQGIEDHCHEKTIGALSHKRPNLPVIASPNAQKTLSKYFKDVTYLEPTGESINLKATNGSYVVVRASPGPILGPPWQRPENGYFIEASEPKFTLYYEPHCVFENASLENESADVVVTPVIKQVIPGYTLVSGQEDAVRVAELLKAKFVVTMKNGDLDSKGILSKFITTEGTTESFQDLLAQKLPLVEVLNPLPGISFDIPISKGS